MAYPVCAVSLTESPIVAPEERRCAEAGAIVDFWGVVRGTEEGAEIAGIEYEAHRAMAEHQLRLLAARALERFELTEVLIRHRIGFVSVGEASLLVRVGSCHRAAAYRASQWIVEELKKRAPIWKHPRLRQGYGAEGASAQKVVAAQV
ncbi:MAG: molybdenum cofactor biosynthesis protein MoaE [Chthoniobacterales bacterium]